MIECETLSGTPCDQVQPPSATCGATGDPIRVVSFTYEPDCTCDKSRNRQGDLSQCRDLGDLVDSNVILTCTDLFNSPLNVNPSNIRPGDEVVVTPVNGLALPAIMNCTISNLNDETLQWNQIDVSGEIELDLKNKFGALQLESCDDQNCLEEVCVEYTVRNLGEVPMSVTTLDVEFNKEGTVDLLSSVIPNPVPVGGIVPVKQEINIDYCVPQTVCLSALVEADPPPPGDSCQDTDELKFDIVPECIVNVELTCTQDKTGDQCSDIPSLDLETCDCPSPNCATELVFEYTGNMCPSNPPGYTCPVNNPLLDPNGAVLTIGNGLNILFSDRVQVGILFTVDNNGFCIPNDLTIRVGDSNINDPILRQEVDLSTGCNAERTGVSLSQDIGAVRFFGYDCRDPGDGGPASCLTDVTFEACAENAATVPVELTTFDVTVMGETRSLPVVPTLLPGASLCDPIMKTISLCEPQTIIASALVEANITNCEDDELIAFNILPNTFAPTSSPTEPPTESPTELPSIPPSAPPTLGCNIEINLIPPELPTFTGIPECEERPNVMGLLFQGGNCTQSVFCVDNDVECESFPGREFEVVYIRVPHHARML